MKATIEHAAGAAVLIMMAAALVPAQQRDPHARAAEMVAQGKTSIPALVAEQERAIAARPDDPEPYVLAAAIYARPESETLLRQAIAKRPDYLPAHLGLGRYHAQQGNAAESLAAFSDALRLAPADAAVRAETVAAAVKAGALDQALALAGEDAALRIEAAQAALDANRPAEARRILDALDPAARNSAAGLTARGRMLYADPQQREQALASLMAAWRAAPALPTHYKARYPRKSLVQVLTEAKRMDLLRQVVARGIEVFPHEYALRESSWKALFATPKPDYAAERAAVRGEIARLLAESPASAELLRVAAIGYDMADSPEDAERTRRRLSAEFPYSNASQMLRRSAVLKIAEPRERAREIVAYHADFLSMPLYSEWLKALDEARAGDAELLAAAEEMLARWYPDISLSEIGEIFLRRRIHLDRLEGWLAARRKTDVARYDAWDVRIASVEGRLLLERGKPAEAEAIMRRVLDLDRQGLSNVDRGRTKYVLALALEAQGRRDEAMELHAQAFAESQRYIAEAGERFRTLYTALKGSEGHDEYLARREDMFQVATKVGIERGTKLDEAAPAFDLLGLDGKRLSLASLKGRVIVVNFWATWCGPCVKELPHFQEFFDRTKGDPAVAVLTITTDENRALVAPYVRKRGFTFPVLFDEGTRAAYGVRGIPATFVIDPEGRLRLRMIGFNPNEPLVPYLEKLVQQYRRP